ncbi:uncharacterized protein LOC109791223 [Cajanus cajan]|uniref:uncharacterized protein LOC109791223 n=1 Tax=Cajanus cajan TaxID=3821 RepID=UPI0010FBB320|nr:uncharacterized protein LOC109791223 [Cajanus cajan]
MGRRKGDPKYTNEVIIIEENKRWKCKHCNSEFSGGFSRIKAHLDKTPGKGIAICSVYCGNEARQNIIGSSSMDPQGALNPLQVNEGFRQMLDPVVGDSLPRQINIFGVAEGDHQMIDTFGNYQINVESTSSLRATQWPDGMNFGGSINYENNAQLITLPEGTYSEHQFFLLLSFFIHVFFSNFFCLI